MSTLSELAKTQQTTTVGQAQNIGTPSISGTNIQPSQTVDKSAGLANDIGKLFGGIMEHHQEASSYAGKRVGTDNLVEYSRRMGELDAMYADKQVLTSADMVEKSRLEQGIYEDHMQRGHFGDNELANQSFKDTYANPATDDLFNRKVNNNNNRVNLFKSEEAIRITSEINKAKDTLGIDNVRTWMSDAKNSGNDPMVVWGEVTNKLNSLFSDRFNDGVNSPFLNNYLEDGALTQSSLDRLFNDVYGRFATRTNGEFNKVYSGMDDKSYDAMKKSFSTWINSLNKTDKTKIDATALKIVDGLKMTNSVEDYGNAYKQLHNQYVAATAQALNGNKDAQTKLPLYRDELVEFEMKAHKKSYLASTYARFIKSENGDIPELYSDKSIKATSKSYSGFDPVERNISVPASEVISYIHNELSKEIDATLNRKEIDVDGMNDLSRKISTLQSSFSGNATKKANGVMKSVANVSAFYNVGSAEELINNLQFSTSYKRDTGADQYTSLTQANLNAVSAYYEELKERQKNDDSLTDQSILSKTRILATAYMDAGSKLAFEKTRDVYRRLGIEYNSDEGDVFVNGAVFTWNVGTAKPTDGALPVAMDMVVNSGKSMESADDAVKEIKGRMFDMDIGKLPIFGTNLALAKPSTSVSDDNLRQNMIDLTKAKLYQYVSVQNVDFADIVDESNIQYRQVNDRRNGLQTIAEIFHNGSIVGRAIIDDDEWVDGVTSDRKAEINKWYKSKGLDNLFEKRKIPKDTSGIERMF